jgi:hypothetical protein
VDLAHIQITLPRQRSRLARNKPTPKAVPQQLNGIDCQTREDQRRLSASARKQLNDGRCCLALEFNITINGELHQQSISISAVLAPLDAKPAISSALVT